MARRFRGSGRPFKKGLKLKQKLNSVAIVGAITEVTIDIMSRAVERAPVMKGDLRGSAGHEIIHLKTITKGLIFFLIVYAARQHEEEDWNHPKGGEAKYLETELKLNRDEFMKRVAGVV